MVSRPPTSAFSADEKLAIAQLLLVQVKVDRIEICSALVSPAEQAGRRIASPTGPVREGRLSQIEALGFADGERSVDWVRSAGVARMNLLVKGSERHCRLQLGLSPAEHTLRCGARWRQPHRARSRCPASTSRIGRAACRTARRTWGRSSRRSQRSACGASISPDTLGVLGPDQVLRHVRRMRRDFPGLSFEFHAHNDYGLATANCLAAVRAGAEGLHTTVNGLGERAGNACLAQVAVALRDHAGRATLA